jgi:hypothetical protein
VFTPPEQISFLPEPDFNPIYPNRGTKKHKALMRLLNGEHLCQLDFLKTSWRLAAYIDELIVDGWPIEKYETDEALGVYIAYYYLPKKIIKLVKNLESGETKAPPRKRKGKKTKIKN